MEGFKMGFAENYKTVVDSKKNIPISFEWSIISKINNHEEKTNLLVDNLVETVHSRLEVKSSIDILCTRVTPETFFYGDLETNTSPHYIPRRIEPLNNLMIENQTTLSEITRKWINYKLNKDRLPILLVGESGAGKTTEQYKLCFDLLLNIKNYKTKRIIPYIIPYYSTLFTGIADITFMNPLENLINHDLHLDFHTEEIQEFLRALQPTIFMFDLSDVEEDNEKRIHFFKHLGDFYQRYPHHLLIIAYRTSGEIEGQTKDEILSLISARDHQVGIFRPFKFVRLKEEQIISYYSKINPQSKDISTIKNYFGTDLTRNPLQLYLISQIPNPEGIESKGQLYFRFVKYFFEEIKRRSDRSKSNIEFDHILMIAEYMCDRAILRIKESEIIDILKLKPNDAVPIIENLTSFGLLQRSTKTPVSTSYFYRFLHDSFVFFFGAYKIRFNKYNEEKDYNDWLRTLDNIIFKKFNSNYKQSILYLTGILHELNELNEFELWFSHRYGSSNKVFRLITHHRSQDLKTSNKSRIYLEISNKIPGKIGIISYLFILLLSYRKRDVIWIPKDAKDVLLELAYYLSLEIEGFTTIIDKALIDNNDEIRSHTINYTINIFDKQTRYFKNKNNSKEPLGALRLLENLLNSFRDEWLQTKLIICILKLFVNPLIHKILPIVPRSSLSIKLESLFYLEIILVGRYLYRSKDNPTISDFFANSGIKIMKPILQKTGRGKRILFYKTITLLVSNFYKKNKNYPCNYFEMRKLIKSLNGNGDNELALPHEVINEISNLFVPSPDYFSSNQSRIKNLCRIQNGLMSWYMNTILSINGNISQTTNIVMGLFDDFSKEAPLHPISSYIAIRTLNSLISFSKAGSSDENASILFEKLSKKIIVDFEWVVTYSKTDSSRRYDNEALLFFSEYLCQKGRNLEFKNLIQERFELAKNNSDFKYCLNTLINIGRRHEFVSNVIDILNWLQEQSDVINNKEKIKLIIDSYKKMLSFNPFIISLAWGNCKNEEIRKKYKPLKKGKAEIYAPINYFGDAIYQKLLYVPIIQENFKIATQLALKQKRMIKFFQSYVETFGEMILSLK